MPKRLPPQRPYARYGYRRLLFVRPPGPFCWVQLFWMPAPAQRDRRWMYRDLIWRMQLGRCVLLVMPRRAELSRLGRSEMS